MRWATYVSPTDGADHVGLLDGDRYLGLAGPTRLVDLLGDDGTALAAAARAALDDPWEVVAGHDVALRPPVPVPPSVRDFMAFEDHVVTCAEAFHRPLDPVWYEQPVFYFTNPAALLGARDPVPISPGSAAFDYEVEVAAVVGRPGADLDPADAEDHIAGYTVLCDWSARDLQAREMGAGLGPAKGKDGATSLGPWLVTPDELAGLRAGRSYDLAMSASVNGREWSRGNLSSIHWSFGELLAYASRGTVLRTGDVIGSGTVGTGCILELSAVHGAEAYPWLRAGDTVRVEVGGLGSVDATVMPGRDPVPLRP